MKSNYIEYEKVKSELEILYNKQADLFYEIQEKKKELKKLLKKCVESKEITIDTLFKLI